jgi:DNA-binding MurR/RpiR family transcriptional regulator
MASDLLQRLESGLENFTAAERNVANFILTNRSTIAFETAASMAEKLRVSAVTVGRFARMMGYRHFKDLKSDLKTSMTGVPWLVGEQLTKFVDASGNRSRTKRSLQLELAGIIEVYGLAETPAWRQIVTLLARAGTLQIAGFQTERGVASTLAHLLQYVRDGVQLVDTAAGNYHEVFASGSTKNRCLVVIDMRRYSEQSYRLAENAQRSGIPLVFITDKFCDWARKFTPHVIAAPTEIELFWSSQVALSCVVNLLVNDVIGQLGAGVEKRLDRLSDLYQTYTGHVGGGKGRRGRNGRRGR